MSILPYKGQLNRCSKCKSYATIDGLLDGIGCVRCSNNECSNHVYNSRYHFGGKSRVGKKEAVRRWNEDNPIRDFEEKESK